jgi:hypothetical protein
MLSRKMTPWNSPSRADLTLLVQQMRHLKQEHRELLGLIAADPDMAPETRKALLDHLMQEEDELVEKIAAAASAASGERPARLTVGSLRAVYPGETRR